MHICLFEDHRVTRFLPLTYFRPVYDLRCGMLTMRERILMHLGRSTISLHCRQYLVQYLREENPGLAVNDIATDEALFINGRCIMSAKLAKTLQKTKTDTLFVSSGEIVAARLSGDVLGRVKIQLGQDYLDLSIVENVQKVEVEATLVEYPWDLVYANQTELVNDFSLLTGNRKQVARKGTVHKSAILVGKKSIHIGKKSIIGAGVVLDATDGPIYIGDNVRVFPNAAIMGPCFVGGGSSVKIGAQIYGNTSIGPVCKVGGEVEQVIFQGYSNKQHDGFAGHAYIGMWVNLGAGTTMSDLKNTYGTVRVRLGEQRIDSGRMFVGLTAGDHVKTGINCTLDTGTVIGPSSNIYGTKVPPKYVPAFSWGESGALEAYDVEKALGVARKVMERRGVELTEAYEEVFRSVFRMTENERTGN